MVELISSWKNITPPKFEFNSLYQMTETEKSEYDKVYAEIDKLKAETESIYIFAQVRAPDEIREEHEWEGEAPVIPMLTTASGVAPEEKDE
jgi:hypothetical protein